MNLTKHLLLALTFVIALSFNQCIFAQSSKTVKTDQGNLKFELPSNATQISEQTKKLLNDNQKNVIYGARYKLDGFDHNFIFSVGKYTSDKKFSIDDAFKKAVAYQPEIKSYKVIEHKTYKKDGKTLRYKISEQYGDTYSIMFFYTKKQKTDTLYLIKTTAKKAEKDKAFKFLEQVALSLQ